MASSQPCYNKIIFKKETGIDSTDLSTAVHNTPFQFTLL